MAIFTPRLPGFSGCARVYSISPEHMVVGNGLLAKAFSEFRDSSRHLFFCSGVSNSTSTNPADYEREWNLLKSWLGDQPDAHLVYFSTCSIGDPSMQQSMYVAHKREIEAYIAENCAQYSIFRLSNVVGHTPNSFTILNFFVNAIRNGSPFRLWTGSTRNLIDIDDVAAIVNAALETGAADKAVINVANPESFFVRDIVSTIETFLGRKGNYEERQVGAAFAIDTERIRPLIAALGLQFGPGYLERLLHKYYEA